MPRQVISLGNLILTSSAVDTSTQTRPAVTELDDADSIGIMVNGNTTAPGLLVQVCYTTESTGLFANLLSFPLSTAPQPGVPTYVTSGASSLWPITFRQVRVGSSNVTSTGYTILFTKQIEV